MFQSVVVICPTHLDPPVSQYRIKQEGGTTTVGVAGAAVATCGCGPAAAPLRRGAGGLSESACEWTGPRKYS